jgi:hypothetical protein
MSKGSIRLPKRGLRRRAYLLVFGALVAVVTTAGCLVAGASTASPNVVPFADARSFAAANGVVARPVVGMAESRSSRGHWVASSDGEVSTFGDAGHFGSLRGVRLARPIVGIVATRTGRGYWLVGSDGGVFSFGDAGFFGSLGGVRLARPIVGIATSRSRHGYWLVGSDGGVFAFGDAGFFGSLGGARLARPMVGMAASRSGWGYWLVGSDGRVFGFGDAESDHRGRGARPIVGIVASRSQGVWLVASDGGLFGLAGAGYPGPSSLYPNFRPPVPGAPIVRVALDDTGLHFTPSHIECGVYNVAFSDTRRDRIPGSEVVLHFYVDNIYLALLSVRAGHTGGGTLGFGAAGWALTVDGGAPEGGGPDGVAHGGVHNTDGQLIVDPPSDPTAACATPIT